MIKVFKEDGEDILESCKRIIGRQMEDSEGYETADKNNNAQCW